MPGRGGDPIAQKGSEGSHADHVQHLVGLSDAHGTATPLTPTTLRTHTTRRQKGRPGLSDPGRLVELAAASDRDFIYALLAYLDRPTPEGEWLFRHDALRRRTRGTIGQLLKMADQKDRKGTDDATRAKWQAVRAAARAERDAIQALPPEGAGPRRRALERLGVEYAGELAQLRAAAASPKMRRSLLEQIAARHPTRMIELLREERTRGESEPAAG